MNKSFLFLIPILTTGTLALLAACGSGNSGHLAETPKSASGTLTAEGQDRGNGGETNDPKRGSAWFAEDTKYAKSGLEEKKTVRYCVVASGDFPVAIDILRSKVRVAASTWIQYLKAHRAFDDGAFEKRLTLSWVETPNCDDSDLKFSFGESEVAIDEQIKILNQPWSLALRKVYDGPNTWGKGVVWFAKPAIYADASGAKYPDWSLSYSIESLLLHEIGHVFGVGHIDGTIMTEDIVNSVKFLNMQNPVLRQKQLTQIDQEFDVIPCHRCDANDAGYEGQLGDTSEMTRNFESLIGRQPRGNIKSFVSVWPSKFSLVVQDDSGSYSIPLEPLFLDETSTDVAVPATPRIRIVQSVQRAGTVVWESNQILSRAGVFERKLKLADGRSIPVKLNFNIRGNPSLQSEASTLRANRFSIVWTVSKTPAVLFQTTL